VKSEGQPSNGSPKPDGIKGVGSVLSPEKCIVVVRKDNPEIQDKADVLDLTEGSSPLHEMASAGVRLIFFIDGLNFELFGGVGEIASFRPYLKTACNLHDLKDAL